MKVLVAAFALALAPVPPYPAQHAGTGAQRLVGGGLFAGTAFTARSAVVDYEIGASCCPAKQIGEVDVYVFEQPGVRCATLNEATHHRFFSYTVETDGRPVPIGEPVSAGHFQQASFNVVGLTTGFQAGIKVVFTRVDASPHGVWHGTIQVPRTTFAGKPYAYGGTFAAAWCGTKRL